MHLRESNLQQLKNQCFDVLIVGGGINGAVSAAVLSARGLKVALIDQRDFAGFTSQESSNLAWGGIKYLETGEFSLVRKLCQSRNLLMRSYPSTVKEIRFFTTIKKGFRFHPLLLYLGTVLYWFMGFGFTQFPRYLRVSEINEQEPVVDTAQCSGGFEYSDAFFHDNDARFVFSFIRSAMDHGCIVANYCQSLGARRTGNEWKTRVRDLMKDEEFTIRSTVLINACGPFADELNNLSRQSTQHRHVFSKGIHLIVDRFVCIDRVLAFFADDGRLFFVIPMGPKICIGTTDTPVDSPYTQVTEEDRQFVLNNINARLKLDKPLTDKDIVAERCGVRPLVVEETDRLVRDWMQLSRQHQIEASQEDNYLSIYGGKLTDCLNVGEEVSEWMMKLGLKLPDPRKKWFGEPPSEVREAFFSQAALMDLDCLTPPSSSEPLSVRFWRRYGEHAFELLDRIRQNPEEAALVIDKAEYTRGEIVLAARLEMVTKLEDFLRRRSKIAQVVRKEDIRQAAGLKQACEILFGDQAEAKMAEYFESQITS